MTARPTLDETLSSEIKREMADRYFGFRKLIEEDKLDLAQKIRQYSFILQKRISFDLIRIYILLRDQGVIQRFLGLINLNQDLFFDPYLIESPTIAQRVFECQHFRGITRFRRFMHYLFDCYESLLFHADYYALKIKELQQEQGMIADEIRLFYEQNDMNAMIGFLRSLGSAEVCGCMQGGMEIGIAEELDRKLHIEVPEAIELALPVLPPLRPLAEIKSELKALIKEAWRHQPPERVTMFGQKGTPCLKREGTGG